MIETIDQLKFFIFVIQCRSLFFVDPLTLNYLERKGQRVVHSDSNNDHGTTLETFE